MIERTQPVYLPFLDNPEVVHMGLIQLPAENWIQPDNQFERYYDNKVALYAKTPAGVYAELPESLDAQQELSGRLLAHLLQCHGSEYVQVKNLEKNRQLLSYGKYQWPIEASDKRLWHSSLWIQDDICLLQEKDARYHLTAASLCAPSSWRLEDKLGRPMFDIHAPVPGLNQKIGRQIDHVLSRLSPLRPFQRFNWSIKQSDELALFPDASDAAADCQGDLFLRVERQTLTRLPKTHAIAFTIRVYLYPLEMLKPIEGALDGLKHAVDTMSADEARYKSLIAIYPKLRAFLKAARAN